MSPTHLPQSGAVARAGWNTMRLRHARTLGACAGVLIPCCVVPLAFSVETAPAAAPAPPVAVLDFEVTGDTNGLLKWASRGLADLLTVDLQGRGAEGHLAAERGRAAPPGLVGEQGELQFRLRRVLRAGRHGGKEKGEAQGMSNSHKRGTFRSCGWCFPDSFQNRAHHTKRNTLRQPLHPEEQQF